MVLFLLFFVIPIFYLIFSGNKKMIEREKKKLDQLADEGVEAAINLKDVLAKDKYEKAVSTAAKAAADLKKAQEEYSLRGGK